MSMKMNHTLKYFMIFEFSVEGGACFTPGHGTKMIGKMWIKPYIEVRNECRNYEQVGLSDAA